MNRMTILSFTGFVLAAVGLCYVLGVEFLLTELGLMVCALPAIAWSTWRVYAKRTKTLSFSNDVWRKIESAPKTNGRPTAF